MQAVLGLERHTLQPLCDAHGAHVAIANGRDHFIVGGTQTALQALADDARAQGAEIRPLPVHVPAHTPLLRSAVAPFAAALDASALQDPRLPLLAGIDARPVRDRATAVHTLSLQLAQTIEWALVMRQAFERGARVFLQLGRATRWRAWSHRPIRAAKCARWKSSRAGRRRGMGPQRAGTASVTGSSSTYHAIRRTSPYPGMAGLHPRCT